MQRAQTVFALASGRGRAGIAVFRLSGPDTRVILPLVCPADAEKILSQPRTLRTASIVCPRRGIVDRGMAVFFPGPRSFSGEDAAELHVHGAPAVVRALHSALAEAAPGTLRPAAPGEFARRAFAAGKLGLPDVEALADLLAAETEAQRVCALHAAGRLGAAVSAWRSTLLNAIAACDAAIDFGDENDASGDLENVRVAMSDVSLLRTELADRISADTRRAAIVRDGARAAVVGSPNAGKSTLFNALVGRAAAIVAPTPGTTRDVLEAHVELAGHAVVLCDTAGVREASEAVEATGVRRAIDAASSADVVLLVTSSDAPPNDSLLSALDPARTIVVRSKADLDNSGSDIALPPRFDQCAAVSFSDRLTSADPSADVAAAIARHVDQLADVRAPPALFSARHGALAAAALGHVDAALAAHVAEGTLVLLADELRAAAHALSLLTGASNTSEDVLDVLFSRFCVGK